MTYRYDFSNLMVDHCGRHREAWLQKKRQLFTTPSPSTTGSVIVYNHNLLFIPHMMEGQISLIPFPLHYFLTKKRHIFTTPPHSTIISVTQRIFHFPHDGLEGQIYFIPFPRGHLKFLQFPVYHWEPHHSQDHFRKACLWPQPLRNLLRRNAHQRLEFPCYKDKKEFQL